VGQPLTTRIVLLVDGMPAAERALASMYAAAQRRAHGFAPTLWSGVDPIDDRFQALLDRVPMDLHAQEGGLAPGRAPAIGEGARYTFNFRFIRPKDTGPFGSRVETMIVTSDQVQNSEMHAEVISFLTAAPDNGAALHCGLWVLAGREDGYSDIIPQGKADRRPASSRRSLYLDRRLAEFAKGLLNARNAALDTVVLSVVGFEYYLIDAYKQRDGFLERPLDFACNRAVVQEILVALIRRAPVFRQLVARCALWQRHGQRRLSLLQPVSANGFFSDDGAPNIDRATGYALVTPDGIVDARSGASPFPRTDQEMPEWVPYLTADPAISIISGSAGDLGILCQDVESSLPKLGRYASGTS